MVFTLLVGMFSFPTYAEGNNTTTTISGDGTAEKTGTMTVTLVIPKKTPAATNLTYTAPSELTYSGSDKVATVAAASGVTGLGNITVKYYSDASRTTEAAPKNVGTYYVGATVAEGDQYAASTAVLYGDGWTFEITKSTPSAPAAPTKASATKNSITLNAVSGCEYSKDGANWQSGTEFTGLNPGTEYTFYQRVKATANTNASTANSASFRTEADTYAMTITLVIVDKDTQTITAENVTATYGDTNAKVSASTNGNGAISYAVKDGSGDYIGVDAATGALTIKKVGTATVIVTAAETDNYAAATKEVTVTINKANAAAATVTANNRTFDGTEKPLVNVTGEATGGEMQYALGTETEATGDFTATIPSKTDAGTYYVWYKVVGDGNHNDYTATAPVTATIARANASVTAPTALNLTYTGQAQALVVAGSTKDGEMQYSLDGVSYSTTIPTGTEAKTYSVWYKVVGDSNHNDTAPAKIEVKINPASASPTAPTADALNYTGKPQALVTGGSVTGGELQYALGKDADTAPALGSFTTTVPTGTDAGDYFVWYRIKGDANHNDVAPVCIPVSIAKATIAPTVSLTGWTYSEDANAPSVDGNPGSGAVTYEYSDKTDGTYSATVPTNAGTWYVKATVAETANHQGATTQPLSFAIAKASITPTVSITGWTYDEAVNAPSVDGNPGNGEVSYTYSDKADGTFTATVPTNAGTWYVRATVAETANYGGATSAATSFAIAKASIAPTVSITGWTYGEAANAPSVTGNPGNGTVTYEYSDAADGTYSATVPTNAGTWFVRAVIAETDNYQGATTQPLSFTIAKAAITPAVSITGWTYGQAANAPSVTGNTGNGAVTYEYSDKTDGTYSAAVPANAGTWYVRASVVETDNYLGATTEPLSFTIAKAAITITADNKSSVYGAGIVALTWKVDGSYVAGDELGISATTTASKTSNVGLYPITVAWNNNANYTATLVNGAYTITKASFDKANLTDAQKPTATNPIYTGGPLALVNAPSGLPIGYTKVQYSIDGGNTWTDAIPTGTEIDSYSVNVKYVGDGNHNDFEGDTVVSIISAKPSGMLIATMVSEGDTSLKLSWAGAEGVGGYDIYFKVCDGKGNYPLIATVEGGDVTSYTVTGLAKNRSYKAYVRAWIMNGGSKQYVLSSSPTVHAYTGNGTKKIANPGSLTLKTPSMTVKLGKTKSIKATVKTVKKGKLATHVAKLRYISSNTSVATVTKKGKVKAVGAGSCKIYVLTTNGIWKTVTVTVDTNPTKVSISKPSKTMKVGATQNLGAKVKLTPAKAITTLSWKSSNPAVATVDSNGVVTAIKKGKTVITVTTANGKKAKVTIKVK